MKQVACQDANSRFMCIPFSYNIMKEACEMSEESLNPCIICSIMISIYALLFDILSLPCRCVIYYNYKYKNLNVRIDNDNKKDYIEVQPLKIQNV